MLNRVPEAREPPMTSWTRSMCRRKKMEVVCHLLDAFCSSGIGQK